jgi:RNA polymerase sigma-70 factor, ECF subfamily
MVFMIAETIVSHTSEDDPFVELLAANQVWLRTYLCTLLRDRTATDDVQQEANVALWKSRKAYDATRDFKRWAAGVALIEVLQYRRKTATNKLQFDESLLNILSADYVKEIGEVTAREAALSECVRKLKTDDRWLLETHYWSGLAITQIASQLGRPVSTLYSSLARIREALYRCIQSQIAQQLHPKNIITADHVE